MSRSRHDGCGRKACGVCRPHKKWKKNSVSNERPSVRRRLQEPVNDGRGEESRS